MAADLQMDALENQATEDSDQPLSDEVEELSKSLREAVQDENVQPKLQCLMMDPSFSMVTVQSEDSNISWETSFNPASSSAPWMQPAAARYGSAKHAGNIIFIMDDVHTVRKKRTKRKAKEKAPPPPPLELSQEEMDESVNRPAMVEVATPNVKDEQDTQGEGEEAETDSSQQKERRLFRLISESTEILNIVVPPKVATVDEEESKTLVDNLAYMEDTPIFHPSDMEALDQCPDLYTSESATEAAQNSPKVEPHDDVPPVSPFQPPPPPTTGPAQDYCNVFTLYDRQSTEATDKKEDDEGAKPDEEAQDASEQAAPEQSVTEAEETANDDSDHPVFSGELCSDLLDDVFYGGMEESTEHEHPESGTAAAQKVRTESTRSLSRKASGSVLFEEEDDVLTPIYLPEGPPKIIDQILLEEPKAMAFLYTDLYEEAVGTRTKDEDAVSQTSEKSFHSQQSDREDKGYLEKFLLTVDGPPLPQAEEKSEAVVPSTPMKEDGKLWPEDVVELAELGPTPEEAPATAHAEEEEVTDFFRDSNTSSPFEMVERADVELEESSIVDNRVRQVTFQEVTAEQEEESTTHDDAEQHLDATVLAELEDLHGKEKPVPDDKVGSTGNKGTISEQSTAETPATSAESQATDKPTRPFLELSTLEPVEAAEGVGESTVVSTLQPVEAAEGTAKSTVVIEDGAEEVKSADVQTESNKDVADVPSDCVPDAPLDSLTDSPPANVTDNPSDI